jgi:hypothetical protein
MWPVVRIAPATALGCAPVAAEAAASATTATSVASNRDLRSVSTDTIPSHKPTPILGATVARLIKTGAGNLPRDHAWR